MCIDVLNDFNEYKFVKTLNGRKAVEFQYNGRTNRHYLSGYI